MEKLKFWFIRFEGADPKLGLENYLNDKFLKIKKYYLLDINNLMIKLLDLIQMNARDKKENINVEFVCATLFTEILNDLPIDKIIKLINIDIDASDQDLFKDFFKKFFSKSSHLFREYNLVISKFYEYVNNQNPKNNEKYKLFVIDYCKKENIPDFLLEYFNDYPDNKKEELALNLHKLYIGYICFKNEALKLIKEAFRYEDK